MESTESAIIEEKASLEKEKTKPVQKRGSLLGSTSIVSFMTVLSRLGGVARDIVVAHCFGATGSVDAFLVAFKIPNFMRRLFAEGAFSQAFIPVLAEHQEKKSHEETMKFISHVAGNLGVVLIGITIIGMYFSDFMTIIFAPGFSRHSERFTEASQMLRITFPYLGLISMTALAGAVLNTYQRFAVPAFTPVLLNVGMIAGALILGPLLKVPTESLAWGVLLAGVLQLLFQLPFLSRYSLLRIPRVNWKDPGVKHMLKLMVPALFGVSVGQINLLLDTIFASFLPVGSVSWLFYSDRLTNFPLGVFGVAIATVILPHLSREHSRQSIGQFSNAMDWGIRLILIIALPAALGLFFMAGPILASLFGNGKFSPHDVYMTRLSLMAFSLGLPAFMLTKILATGFYASQNIKIPVKVGIVSMVANSLLCLLFIKPFAHMGLAMASTIAGFINAGGLFFYLIKHKLFQAKLGWKKFILQIICANSLMSIWLWFRIPPTSQWIDWDIWHRFLHLFPDIIVGIILYLLVLFFMGVRPSHFFGKHSPEV